jgi:hypothetical protein
LYTLTFESRRIRVMSAALRATLDGRTLEEVRFLRDEQANMVWAVEVTTENGVGRPWNGRERALDVPAPVPPATTAAPLRYQLQTTLPINWIPFVPVQLDLQRRAVALERAAMQRVVDGALTTVQPVGRVLAPTNVTSRYRVRDEEVERSGTRVLRAARRPRWIDGSTHVWISRRQRRGAGEGVSGLKYDVAVPVGAVVRAGRRRFVIVHVIGGNTEITMLVRQADVRVPLLDTTELHAIAAVEYALAS